MHLSIDADIHRDEMKSFSIFLHRLDKDLEGNHLTVATYINGIDFYHN